MKQNKHVISALDNSADISLFLEVGQHGGDEMESVHDGQCGLCSHFGENHSKSDVLMSITTNKTAETTLIDECGHPKLVSLHLKVTPISGCDGFVPAAAA